MQSFKLGVITHIVGHLPDKERCLLEVASKIPINEKEAKKIIKTTGFSHIREADNETSKDLCLSAAKKLISKLSNDEINDIDVILFVSQSRDYIMPQTSGIIQNELGLKTNVVCKDIPLGCSGYVFGLMEALMFVKTGMKNVLLLAGDTSTKLISSKDKSVRMVFGDGGSATLIKSIKSKYSVRFDYGTDGKGFKDLIIKSGGMRNPCNSSTAKVVVHEPGISRSDNDLFMNGFSVMNFTIDRVPNSIKLLSERLNGKINRYYLHQANRFMINYLVKKVKSILIWFRLQQTK